MILYENSGCGGLSLGLQNAGFNIAAAFDFWDKAVQVYNDNFDHPCYQQDLKNRKESIDLITSFEPEMIVGGPPCQDFSSAGKRDISLGRADLTYDFAHIVNSIKPNWFIMENVDRIKGSHILHEIIEDFIRNGYGLTSVILDASLCNVPQSRKRFFLIGELNGKHNTLLPYLRNNLATSPMSVKNYIGNDLDISHYYRHPRNYSRRAIFSVNEPSPTIRGVNRPLPKTYIPNNCDGNDFEIEKVRPLTTVERSYIQTFPKNFIFRGTKTNLEQIIGNAVPVNLASFVGNAINQYIKDKVILNKIYLDEKFILSTSVLKKSLDLKQKEIIF